MTRFFLNFLLLITFLPFHGSSHPSLPFIQHNYSIQASGTTKQVVKPVNISQFSFSDVVSPQSFRMNDELAATELEEDDEPGSDRKFHPAGDRFLAFVFSTDFYQLGRQTQAVLPDANQLGYTAPDLHLLRVLLI